MPKLIEPVRPPIDPHVIAFTGTATAGVDVSGGASGIVYVMFKAEDDCYVIFGSSTSLTATSSDMLLQPQDGWIQLRLGRDSHFVSVIRKTNSSNLHYYIVGGV